VGLGEPSSFGQTDLSQSRILKRERRTGWAGAVTRQFPSPVSRGPSSRSHQVGNRRSGVLAWFRTSVVPYLRSSRDLRFPSVVDDGDE
jgi:hypothetical protein